ncbi:hypothetical protein AOA14_15040 [Sphingopyxis terrae subsp. terrae NBRC 15098]|uniref:DUF885 domain-containing protein n=1 Tax=Sphingopyxis terrae subsp. terrae NBRC 15098 TaxID=1219058 RepID=A0A142W2Z3_9SPHN|nr:DUF885 domain-containing protein [Sphingopyxis terrae]AMU95927.1 hypothetical protein AOA14_15040 [Sphingopyxis terrae subsp. terrae NBRC 15098]
MTRKFARFGGAAMAGALLVLAACSAEKTPQSAGSAANWTEFRDQFLAGYFPLNPNFAVYQGKHEFDGQLPDWSAAGLQKQIAFLEKTIADAQAFDGKMSDAEKFERDYLVHVAQGQLFFLKDADFPHKNPAFYVGQLDPNVYISRPYADPATRMKAFISYAEKVPAAAAQIKANLKLPMPATFVKYGSAGFGGFADYYTGDAKAAFADVKDPALQKQFDEVAAKAAAAMKDLAAYVASQPGSADGWALGADKFSKMLLTNEAVDTPLDELERIGQADLKRNQDALKAACATYAAGMTIADCMKKMGSDKPADGPVAEARRQLPMLRAFLVEKDLVSIPGTEQAQVEESPPYNRQNSAYIDIPGPYEKGLPSVYYISPPDPSWDKQTQLDFVPGKKDLLFTSVHEVWPGHFLNFLHSNRAESIFGKLFVGYAFAEGWAHYTEEMMWDAGLGDGDPETHIGQLSNALLRNCRYLSAIGLHTKGMTVADSEKLFKEQCYQDEGNARQQAARGTYDPLYLNYTMGKLMIRKLREDWTKGDKTKWKAFHDEFLSYGGPPIPMVRAAMMKEASPKAVF